MKNVISRTAYSCTVCSKGRRLHNSMTYTIPSSSVRETQKVFVTPSRKTTWSIDGCQFVHVSPPPRSHRLLLSIPASRTPHRTLPSLLVTVMPTSETTTGCRGSYWKIDKFIGKLFVDVCHIRLTRPLKTAGYNRSYTEVARCGHDIIQSTAHSTHRYVSRTTLVKTEISRGNQISAGTTA